MSDQTFTQNRELSWLRFNERVLEEATDEAVPLLERLKFVEIFTSNLDEFFMVRVGSLFDLARIDPDGTDPRSGMTAEEQLSAIYDAVKPLYREKEEACAAVEKQLKMLGICRLRFEELSAKEKKTCTNYFERSVFPILSPQIVDAHHPFPHLKTKVLHIGAWLEEEKNHRMFGVIPLPSALPPALFLKGDGLHYIAMEDLLLHFTETVFDHLKVLEKVVFCVTRDSDLDPEDVAYVTGEDFRKKMKKILKQRLRLAPVRLELSAPVSGEFLDFLKARLPVTDRQIFITSAPLKLKYVYSLPERLPEEKRRVYCYGDYTPQIPPDLVQANMTETVKKRDILLSYPYDSMEPFLNLIREASDDPNVISIKITIYRLASRARLVDYLCSAAEHGKDVTVLIELQARFDEQNNIDWSERLEDAGCTVVYGVEDYKVHSKICLITRRERGVVSYITQIGTGNYNEKTAMQYTDLCLITASRAIGEDAAEFFQNMSMGDLEGDYSRLAVSPKSMKQMLLTLMDREIAKRGRGRLLFKVNSITDMDIIGKLKQASCAGVQIQLIVRGICCILPGVPERTENIRIRSIVGRYLEHSRIYCFGEGDSEILYISSADFMTRNLDRRVEVACPIEDPKIRASIHTILDAHLADNVKARELTRNGTYRKVKAGGESIDSQQLLMDLARRRTEAPAESEPPERKIPLLTRLRKMRPNG